MGHKCGYESVLAMGGSGLDSSVNVLYAVNKTLKSGHGDGFYGMCILLKYK